MAMMWNKLSTAQHYHVTRCKGNTAQCCYNMLLNTSPEDYLAKHSLSPNTRSAHRRSAPHKGFAISQILKHYCSGVLLHGVLHSRAYSSAEASCSRKALHPACIACCSFEMSSTHASSHYKAQIKRMHQPFTIQARAECGHPRQKLVLLGMEKMLQKSETLTWSGFCGMRTLRYMSSLSW